MLLLLGLLTISKSLYIAHYMKTYPTYAYSIFSPGQVVKEGDWIAGQHFKHTELGPLVSLEMVSYGPGKSIPDNFLVCLAWASDYRKSGYALEAFTGA